MPDLWHIGSFQTGAYLPSENPLEEVWSLFARIGTEEYTAQLVPVRPNIDWEKHRSYAVVRIRQALEFRRAAQASSLLTRPLPLYYAILNLFRATMALVPEVISARSHGLKHATSDQILDNAAQVTAGTFSDYLAVFNLKLKSGTRLILRDCLARIPELSEYFNSPSREGSRAIPVLVQGKMSGRVTITFNEKYLQVDRFRREWASYFPKLAPVCELAQEGPNLRVLDGVDTASYEAICTLCARHLETHLKFSEQPTWFAIRQEASEVLLPRPAYYFAALFILCSAVRYEPEILLEHVRTGSEQAWLLERFLNVCERFLPQLLYSWIHGVEVFF